jgi:hypothetical protein
MEEGEEALAVPSDSSEVVKEIGWSVPKSARGGHRIEADLKDAAGEVLSHNYFDFTVTEDASSDPTPRS